MSYRNIEWALVYKDPNFVIIAASTYNDSQLIFFDTHHIEDVI